MVFVEDAGGVEAAFGDLVVEVALLLEAHLADEVGDGGLVVVELLVLEAALQQLLGVEALLLTCLLEREAQLGAGTGGDEDAQPLRLRSLVAGRQDLDRVATVEGRAEGDILAVDLAADAGVADARVDMVGEVEHGGSLWETSAGRPSGVKA